MQTTIFTQPQDQITVERWLPVVGYEGLYEVSDWGNVRSLDRISRRGRTLRGRPLAQTKCIYGYLSASLLKNGERKLVKIHKLVLEAFVCPRPEGMEVCHNNGHGADNRLSNLRWDTHASNNRDRVKHGTAPWLNITHCPHGHEYDEPNTYYDPRGGKRCRACHRERQRGRLRAS
jgi:hypothetical protein